MIKLGKIVPLICIIFFVNLYFVQPVFAQIKKSKYLVGSIENFKNNFSQKIIQRKKTGKTFAVGEGKFFIGKIAHQNTNDTSLHVFGSIDSIINASFYLQFNRNKLHGAILLPDQKKAYQYSSDISGQVHVEAASLDKFICTDYILSEGNHIITKPDTNNSAIPLLENSPDAAGCIYLDFDGELIKNSYWDNGRTINAAPSGMSTEDIKKTWLGVCEDYLPFNLNITTDEKIFYRYPKGNRQRIIITPTNYFATGYGGIAYVGSFSWVEEQPCFGFLTDNSKFTAEICSHEIGHTLGLTHDGRHTPSEEYYRGDSLWGPIMGTSYTAVISQWSKGEYANANNFQDDLLLLSYAGLKPIGYKKDDHGNKITDAKMIYLNDDLAINQSGIIENSADEDFFYFITREGKININVQSALYLPNLDIVLRLYDSSKNLLFEKNNPHQLDASLNIPIAKGKYYLSISNTGYGNPLYHGYSAYGSLGSYRITGNLPLKLDTCYSFAMNASKQYIDLIAVSNLIKVSGNNGGYGNFKNLGTILHCAKDYTFYFQAGSSDSNMVRYWGAWIDYNNDGFFSEEDEQIMKAKTYTNELNKHTFHVPDSLLKNRVTLRIVMKFDEEAKPCEIFNQGEVEEYYIDLENTNKIITHNPNFGELNNNDNLAKIFPNPGKDKIQLIVEDLNYIEECTFYSMNTAYSKNFLIDKNSSIIDISDIPSGVYSILLKIDNKISTQKFIKY